MAELTSSGCATDVQATCCAPGAKASCCEPARADARWCADTWRGRVAGALTRAEHEEGPDSAALVAVEAAEPHRVHPHAGAAVVRAVRP